MTEVPPRGRAADGGRSWHWGVNYRLLVIVQALVGLAVMFFGLDDSSLFRGRYHNTVPVAVFGILFLMALLILGPIGGVWLPGLLARLAIWLGLALPPGGYFVGIFIWPQMLQLGERSAAMNATLVNMPYIAGASAVITIMVYVLDRLVLRHKRIPEPPVDPVA